MDKKPIRDIVKDNQWQKVRESLLGKWKHEPEWCCKQLRDYLGKLTGATNNELRIVMNYLTGTGFRIGVINHTCISKLRNEISQEIKERKGQARWY
jgi:hypothetical protein